MRFDTKIVIVVRGDIPTWQKLNMTAFLASGIAATRPETIGLPYGDASGRPYAAMFRQPVMVLSGTAEELRAAFERACERGLNLAVFTDELFATGHDAANRAAVAAVPTARLALAGFAVEGAKNQVDRALKGLALHG
jgi:hypothetical protein